MSTVWPGWVWGSARGTIWWNCPVSSPLEPVSEPAHGGSGDSQDVHRPFSRSPLLPATIRPRPEWASMPFIKSEDFTNLPVPTADWSLLFYFFPTGHVLEGSLGRGDNMLSNSRHDTSPCFFVSGVFLLARLSLTNLCQNCLTGNKVIAGRRDPGRVTHVTYMYTH